MSLCYLGRLALYGNCDIRNSELILDNREDGTCAHLVLQVTGINELEVNDVPFSQRRIVLTITLHTGSDQRQHVVLLTEYWMACNHTGQNGRAEALEEVLQDPGSVVLFVGYPRWLLLFAAGCCALFMLVGIPGNLFTIITLFRTRKLRNATAVFIMNLSVSDLMFCCFNLPLAASTFWHSSWPHGALLCRLFPLLRYGLVAVSLFTILGITINRYVMIGHHRIYPRIYEPKYLVPMVLSTWITAFGVLIVTWFEGWGRFGLDTTIGSCSILPDVHGRSPKEFLFVVAFLTPCIAIVVCYARIFYIVRKAAFRSRRSVIVKNKEPKTNHKRSPSPPKSKKEEPSVPATGLCTDFTKYAPPKRLNNSRTPSRSAIEESLSDLESSSQEQNHKEDLNNKNKERHLSFSSRHLDDKNKENPLTKCTRKVSTEANVCDKIQPDSEIKIDDAPYANESDTYDVTDSVFSSNDPGKSKESSVKASTNARNKLERMVSTASFIIESAFWAQRLDSKALSADRLEKFRSHSSGQTVKTETIDRNGSRFRCVRRFRNVEAPKMSNKDKKLLKMILVIFSSFLICYLPITVTKIFKNAINWKGLNIVGYILIYLTTCINPVVYVIMSSEYRSAYKDALLCRSDSRMRSVSRKLLT
ncbi:G-protein coupled receptor moody [Calliopsis andreniformis]|uniref:G-protein coupled receptor moody n=1 Tax=Calliopsis andreniformis TaxID=337506 RepID=UPI003FCEA0F2